MINEEALKALDDEYQKAKEEYCEAKARLRLDKGPVAVDRYKYTQGVMDGLSCARETLWMFRSGK